MNYIDQLAEEVKRSLSIYIQQRGRTISRNGTFSCLMEYNHKNRDATPSATIAKDSNGCEVWFCHVCQRGGTIYDLVAELEGLPTRGKGFVTTTVELAQRLGIPFNLGAIPEMDDTQKQEVSIRALLRDIGIFIAEHGNAREHLTSGKFGRTYSDEDVERIVNKFTLGVVDTRELHAYLSSLHGDDAVRTLPFYNHASQSLSSYLFSKDRLTLVVKDVAGNVVGFVSRKSVDDTSESPRYFNSVKKKSSIFGIDVAAEHIKRTNNVYVVEGPFDCITMVAKGYENTVALLGLPTQEQIQRLIQLHASVITHVPDGDERGRKATYTLATTVSLSDAFVRAIDLGNGVDPDSYLRTVSPTLPEPIDAISFVIERYDQFHDQSIPNETRYLEMVRFIAEAKKINARVNDYARLVQKYHGYTIDGIIKDIETHEDRPTSVAHAESRLWKEIERAKGAPLYEKIGKLEEVVTKMKDLAASTSRLNVAELTWNTFLSLLEGSTGIPKRFKTGFSRLDTMCSIEGSELTFVSGWPSHGKSSFMRALAFNILKNNPNTHCIYLSSDDNVLSVISTFVALLTGIEKPMIKELIVEDSKRARDILSPHLTSIKQLFTNDLTVLGLDTCQSISQLHQRILQLAETHQGKRMLVVVDALNNLTDVDTEDKVYGIETAIRKLKRIAASTNSAFLVINHLTKHDGKIDRRPMVSNLKGSSFIEYEAKTIFLVHMDAHVNRESQMQWYTGKEMFPVVEVNVAKDKDKKANELIFFKFNPATCEFIETTPEEHKHYQSVMKKGAHEYEEDDSDTIVSV